MTATPVKIYFLTWPDGQLFEGSQNSISEDMAIGRALRTWLIPQFFPKLDFGSRYHGPMEYLWRSMREAGFKVHSIEVPDVTGVSS